MSTCFSDCVRLLRQRKGINLPPDTSPENFCEHLRTALMNHDSGPSGTRHRSPSGRHQGKRRPVPSACGPVTG